MNVDRGTPSIYFLKNLFWRTIYVLNPFLSLPVYVYLLNLIIYQSIKPGRDVTIDIWLVGPIETISYTKPYTENPHFRWNLFDLTSNIYAKWPKRQLVSIVDQQIALCAWTSMQCQLNLNVQRYDWKIRKCTTRLQNCFEITLNKVNQLIKSGTFLYPFTFLFNSYENKANFVVKKLWRKIK